MNIKDYGFVFEWPHEETQSGTWFSFVSDGGMLRMQREALGYTQQQVASLAHITLRQYQRFESGERKLESSSFRIGLNVCFALKINPMFYCDIFRNDKQDMTFVEIQTNKI